MKERMLFEATSDLEEVTRRFEAWRSTKEHASTRIPETLWDEAVQLTEVHSICHVSKALRLDFNHLKRRVHSRRSTGKGTADSAVEFVELKMPEMVSASQCSIELGRSDGASVRMHIKGAIDPQLVEIARSFLGHP